MKWVTRERPKIDRIACPWLIAPGHPTWRIEPFRSIKTASGGNDDTQLAIVGGYRMDNGKGLLNS